VPVLYGGSIDAIHLAFARVEKELEGVVVLTVDDGVEGLAVAPLDGSQAG
jgi:hypothetical protein